MGMGGWSGGVMEESEEWSWGIGRWSGEGLGDGMEGGVVDVRIDYEGEGVEDKWARIALDTAAGDSRGRK